MHRLLRGHKGEERGERREERGEGGAGKLWQRLLKHIHTHTHTHVDDVCSMYVCIYVCMYAATSIQALVTLTLRAGMDSSAMESKQRGVRVQVAAWVAERVERARYTVH